jgi:hypothetical protein
MVPPWARPECPIRRIHDLDADDKGAVEIGKILGISRKQVCVCTENVVARPDSAAKAFVGAGGVSPADAESLIAFHLCGKWEYGRRFFLPGADAPWTRHNARLCDALLPAYATRM